jgi:L-ornithine N5-oxygenase
MKAEYPPRRHQEYSVEKMHKVIDRFGFATVISNGQDLPLVTHIPMILDRSRGDLGVLFGHIDRFNPQLQALKTQPALAVFHGPNAFISPSVYTSSQLPTWNSISVHAKGRIRIIDSNEELVEKLVKISRHADQHGAFLDPKDPRIPNLIDYIAGFEIIIESLEGKFKLSQDRNADDQVLAKFALIKKSEESERDFIESLYL